MRRLRCKLTTALRMQKEQKKQSRYSARETKKHKPL